MFAVLKIRCTFVTTNTETELFKLQKTSNHDNFRIKLCKRFNDS